MKVKKITIRNFRGFASYEAEMPTNMTVVIGNNTSGKTTFLQALQVGLGAYLQSLKTLPGGKAYRRNFKSSDRLLAFDREKKDYFPLEERTKISIDAEMADTINMSGRQCSLHFVPISWYREMTEKDSTLFNASCAGELMQFVERLEYRRQRENDNSILPVVLSFGTDRIDNQYRSARKVKERLQRIDKAYKAALLDQADFSSVIDWLRRYDKNVKDGKEFEGTREAFFDALSKGVPALSEIEFDHGEIEAVVTVSGKQPQRHHYSYMSDGFKAMINIVSEIAYRSVQLNGFLGKEAVRMTPGVVVIDEVDLYLHPHWQRHILSDLQDAFPQIQFVVTTHSPFIIQSVKEGQLISLDPGVKEVGEPFKESLEDIAAERMGMDNQLRSKRFNEMVDASTNLFEALDKGDEQEVETIKSRLDQIEADFSDDPAYVSMIRLMAKTKVGEQ